VNYLLSLTSPILLLNTYPQMQRLVSGKVRDVAGLDSGFYLSEVEADHEGEVKLCWERVAIGWHQRRTKIRTLWMRM
jgi:hypothetical protein